MSKNFFLQRKAVTKIQAVIIAVVILVAAIAGVAYYTSLPRPSPTPEYKRTLVIAVPEELEGLDIQQVSWSAEVQDLVFQSFMNYDENMDVVSDLAIDAKIEDNSVIIYLPTDAKFSNGNPITAEIVRDSIERYRKLSIYGSDYEAVVGYEIIDEHTLKILCDVPPVYIWYNDVTTIYGAIVDTTFAEEIGDAAFNEKPIGPGPYKVKEWVHGSHVVLERNDLYKTNLPFVENKGPNTYIDEVIIRFIPEDLTRVSELEAGTVDIVRGVPADAVSRLKTNPNIVLYETMTPGVEYILINVKKPPLDDVKVRQALMYAVNRDEIKATLDDTVLTAYTYMSPSMLAYNASLEEYAAKRFAYNVETAKSLLEEAGWVDTDGDGIVEKNGEELALELLVPYDDPKLKKIGPLLQARFADVGLRIEVREFDYIYIRDRTRAWDFELACRFYSWHDPPGILPYLVHSEMGNLTYSNPEVDSLLDKDRTTALNPTERTELYTEVQLMLLDDTPWIPLFINIGHTAASKNVEGLIVMPPYATLFVNDVKILKGGKG